MAYAYSRQYSQSRSAGTFRRGIQRTRPSLVGIAASFRTACSIRRKIKRDTVSNDASFGSSSRFYGSATRSDSVLLVHNPDLE
jgi:hypothetical protein